jgi:hypothetical protein
MTHITYREETEADRGRLAVGRGTGGHCRAPTPEGRTDISALTWILIVAGGWLCLAAAVGVVVGRVIRNRDRQIPTDSSESPIPRPGVERKSSPRGN